MIDFTNYTPSSNAAALAAPGTIGDIGRDTFTDMMMRLFPGVIDSVSFSLILLAVFFIALPVVIWLIETGRVKNE